MPKIKTITVRAGRTVPHPLYGYGNLRSDLEYEAELLLDEDPDEVRMALQAQVESEVEQHVAELKDGIRDLEGQQQTRSRIKRLETELAEKTEELEGIRAEFDDRPLLAPRKNDT